MFSRDGRRISVKKEPLWENSSKQKLPYGPLPQLPVFTSKMNRSDSFIQTPLRTPNSTNNSFVRYSKTLIEYNTECNWHWQSSSLSSCWNNFPESQQMNNKIPNRTHYFINFIISLFDVRFINERLGVDVRQKQTMLWQRTHVVIRCDSTNG